MGRTALYADPYVCMCMFGRLVSTVHPFPSPKTYMKASSNSALSLQASPGATLHALPGAIRKVRMSVASKMGGTTGVDTPSGDLGPWMLALSPREGICPGKLDMGL
eukprot:scaffold205718_cov19-Tisochrysis_lutea.AAC.1